MIFLLIFDNSADFDGCRKLIKRKEKNITFFEIKGQDLLMNLDMLNIAISYGSACSSGTTSAPLALLESGFSEYEACCSVRISIGKFITKGNIDKLILELSLDTFNEMDIQEGQGIFLIIKSSRILVFEHPNPRTDRQYDGK